MKWSFSSIFSKCFSSFIKDLTAGFDKVFNGLNEDIKLLKNDRDQVNKTIKELQEENTNIKSRIAKLEETVIKYFDKINSEAATQRDSYERMLQDFSQLLKQVTETLTIHVALNAFSVINEFLLLYVLENESEKRTSELEEKRNRCLKMTQPGQINSYCQSAENLWPEDIKKTVGSIDSFFAEYGDFQKQIKLMEGGELSDSFIIPEVGQTLNLKTMNVRTPVEAQNNPDDYEVRHVLSIGIKSKHIPLKPAVVIVQKKVQGTSAESHENHVPENRNEVPIQQQAKSNFAENQDQPVPEVTDTTSYKCMLNNFSTLLQDVYTKLRENKPLVEAYDVVNNFLYSHIFESMKKFEIIEKLRTCCLDMAKDDQANSYFKNHSKLEKNIEKIVNRIDIFMTYYCDFEEQIKKMEGVLSLTDCVIIPHQGQPFDPATMYCGEFSEVSKNPDNYLVCNVLSIGIKSKYIDLVKAEVQVQEKAQGTSENSRAGRPE